MTKTKKTTRMKKIKKVLISLDDIAKKYNWIFLLINIILILGLIILLSITLTEQYLSNLGINTSFILMLGATFVASYIILIIFRAMLLFYLEKDDQTKVKNFIKRFNNYLIACILLISLFTIFGFSIINDAYKVNNEFTFELPTSEHTNTNKSSEIKCNTYFDTFVESYDLRCISYLNHHNSSFKPIGILLRDGNQSDLLNFEIDKEDNVVFNIPVKEGKNKYHIEYHFNKNSNVATFYRRDIEFRAITEEIYFERIHQKNLLIFAVLSFSFFSVIASMKYLKDLMGDGKK